MSSSYLLDIARRYLLPENVWKCWCEPFVEGRRSMVEDAPVQEITHRKTAWDNNTWTMATILGVGIGGLWAYKKGYLTSQKISEERQGNAPIQGDRSRPESSTSVTQVDDYKEGEPIPNLPFYTTEEIASHNKREKRVWCTFRQGVYDVTDFIHEHPGGPSILLAAGKATDPFWNVYAIHKEPHVLKLLARYRIGNISSEEHASAVGELANPFLNEPQRHPALKIASQFPFNAEAPLELLADKFLTPPELHYVRNHFAVPAIDEKEYFLTLEGFGFEKPLTFSLEDLKAMPNKRTITVTLQCAGNRRSELMDLKPIEGVRWKQGMISNAAWTGVRLHDFLKAANVDFDKCRGKHIQYEGTDLDPTGRPYGSSVPVNRVLNPDSDILIAYEMNGKPLPPDHGYPARIVVPGVAGARSCKWLRRIIIADEESECLWHRSHYKGVAPSETPETADLDNVPATMELPVNSAFMCPKDGDTVKVVDGKIKIKGYAWSGGGKPIFRVDVSADGGETWHKASLDYKDDLAQKIDTYNGCWSWTLWAASVPVPPMAKEAQLVVKAVDSAYNTQPANVKDIWNFLGVLSNAYHRVNVSLKY